MLKITYNKVTETGPRDLDGASAFRIDETDSVIYEGSSRIDAISALREIPVGTSVSVRYPGGIRSCMNKPALWNDIANY